MLDLYIPFLNVRVPNIEQTGDREISNIECMRAIHFFRVMTLLINRKFPQYKTEFLSLLESGKINQQYIPETNVEREIWDKFNHMLTRFSPSESLDSKKKEMLPLLQRVAYWKREQNGIIHTKYIFLIPLEPKPTILGKHNVYLIP